ncbi:MAG: hypothetical protein H0X63_10055 [Flavobacteriales bacterium]|nr:hypothetical protein [Flavobacteriales bacterium]
MKNSLILLALAALLFAGCGNKKSNVHEHDSVGNHTNMGSVHQHEDGTVRLDIQDDEYIQQEFKIEIDSASNKVEEHGHSHEGHSHKH